ncbi:MAG TPA: aldolase/citrate lyase family protein [Opitutaceae bacterium]|nr:aldolase/citrate lyase family protein [Opitutaceae bacterium]
MSKIKSKLRAGQPTVGSWMQLSSPSVAEIMGCAGYDWVAVDLEHGSFALDTLPDIFRALELGGTAPFARIGENSCKEIKQAIEAGARGIIIPMVECRQDAEQAVAWANYPPAGIRGVGYSRANLFGRRFKEHLAAINDELLVAIQIESITAIRSLDEILAVRGVDALMIGPYDLSASMGITGQFEDPAYIAALELARQKASEHKIPMGLHIVQPDPALLKTKIAEGYQFIAYGIDAVFLNNFAINPLTEKL